MNQEMKPTRKIALIALRNALIKIDQQGPINTSVGIESNLIEMANMRQTPITDYYREYAKKWPGFSGDNDYPVPQFAEQTAHLEYALCENKWDTETYYSGARRRLLVWMIVQLLIDLKLPLKTNCYYFFDKYYRLWTDAPYRWVGTL